MRFFATFGPSVSGENNSDAMARCIANRLGFHRESAGCDESDSAYPALACFTRRDIMHLHIAPIAALAILGLVSAHAPAAAAWPDRPIRVIVSFPAGSSTDIPARIVAQQLSVRLGQPLVIENVAGAAGAVGARAIARAPADGYTIGLASSSAFSIMPIVQANLGYDPQKDYAPLSLIGRSPYVIVASPTLPVKTLPELIAHARANPGALNYGTAGANSLTHLATLHLAAITKTTFNHVPYRSSAASGTDLMAGRIQFAISGVAAALQLLAAGVTPLAATSERRIPSLPNIPTAIEAGVPGFDVAFWLGFVAPAGTPRDIVERLSKEVNAVLDMPEVRNALAAQGLEAEGTSPEGFSKLIETEIARWRDVAQSAGLKPE